jgi:hypothetical protein
MNILMIVELISVAECLAYSETAEFVALNMSDTKSAQDGS